MKSGSYERIQSEKTNFIDVMLYISYKEFCLHVMYKQEKHISSNYEENTFSTGANKGIF